MEKDEETEIAVECSVLGVCFLFDVGRSMFDVGCSFFKTTKYGFPPPTCECARLKGEVFLRNREQKTACRS